jgi:hypothetical protein
MEENLVRRAAARMATLLILLHFQMLPVRYNGR